MSDFGEGSAIWHEHQNLAMAEQQINALRTEIAALMKERDDLKERSEDLAADKGTYFRMYEQACIRLTEKDAALGSCCRKNDAELATLRQVCRNVYEVWAGSEGIPEPTTCSESYLLSLVIAMRDEAKKGLK